MVRLDHCGFSAKTALYNVRINGSLCKEINGSDFLRFFLENTDKFLTDDLTLCFRLSNSGKLIVVSLLCINADKIQVELSIWSKYALYLITLVFTKKTVIYEYAGQLLSDCSGKKSCCHRGIHAA